MSFYTDVRRDTKRDPGAKLASRTRRKRQRDKRVGTGTELALEALRADLDAMVRLREATR